MTYRTSKQGADYGAYEAYVRELARISDSIPGRFGSTFRIISYNIHYMVDRMGNDTFSSMMAEVCGLDATVICLQEVPHIKQSEVVRAFSSYGYRCYMTTGTSYRKSLGNMICVKSGIYSKQIGELDLKSYRKAIAISIMGVIVINTHLEVKSDTIREEQSRTIMRWISSLGPNVILCGDMNATIDKKSIQIFLINGLIDSCAASGQPSRDMTCWAGTCVDYILASPMIKAIGTSQIYSVSSDHMAIIADYNVRIGAPSSRACRALGCTSCAPGKKHYCRNCKSTDSDHRARECPTLIMPVCEECGGSGRTHKDCKCNISAAVVSPTTCDFCMGDHSLQDCPNIV